MCVFRVNFEKLEHLNFEGCEKISDNAFKYLLSGRNSSKSINCVNICKYDELTSFKFKNGINQKINCDDCIKNHLNEEDHLNDQSTSQDKNDSSSSLNSINLSGCYLVTDFSLKYVQVFISNEFIFIIIFSLVSWHQSIVWEI